MPKRSKKVLWPALILVSVFIMGSLALAAFPKPQGFINDYANVFDQRNKAELTLIVDKLKSEQGIEMAVVTVPTTEPLDPKEYTTALFNEWGVGGPEDSGLLILLAIAEGAIEVEPGYGLEGALPDGLIGAVIDQAGIPHFKNRDYAKGIVEMARAYASILAGETFEVKKEEEKPSSGWITSFVIFVLIAVLLRRSRSYPRGGAGGVGGGGGTRRPVIIPGPTIGAPRGSRGGIGGGSRPSSGGFGGGRSGGGGAGRRF